MGDYFQTHRGDRPVARSKPIFQLKKFTGFWPWGASAYSSATLNGLRFTLYFADGAGELPRAFQNLILRPGGAQDKWPGVSEANPRNWEMEKRAPAGAKLFCLSPLPGLLFIRIHTGGSHKALAPGYLSCAPPGQLRLTDVLRGRTRKSADAGGTAAVAGRR